MKVEINRVLHAITKSTNLAVKDNDWRTALPLMEQMKSDELQPKLSTYTAAISAYAKVER